MTSKAERPVSAPVPAPTAFPKQRKVLTLPKEPSEVLGRHKNTGQKDHKGAR